MRKLLVGVIALSVLAAPGVASAKVGVVSWEAVLAKSSQGKKILATIKGYYGKKQRSISRRKAALQTEEKVIIKAFKRLEASKALMKGSVYKARKTKLEARYRRLLLRGQRLIQQVQTENQQLQKKRYTLLKPLKTIFLSAVEFAAKAKGLQLVIEKGAVYYHVGTIDITAAVLARVNTVTKP